MDYDRDIWTGKLINTMKGREHHTCHITEYISSVLSDVGVCCGVLLMLIMLFFMEVILHAHEIIRKGGYVFVMVNHL